MTSQAKGLQFLEVRQAREQEVKYSRDLGVHEEVDERAVMAHYHDTRVDTKWVDTNKAFDGKSMQIRSRIVARDFKSIGQICLQGLFHWKH